MSKTRPVQAVALWIGVIIPALLFPALVLLSPSNVLTSRPELVSLCMSVQRFLEAWFPKADLFSLARSVEFSEVATLATVFACLWWPWATTWIATISMLNAERRRAALQSDIKSKLALVFVAPAFGVIGFFVFFALPDEDLGRSGFALLGAGAVLIPSLLIGLLPLSLSTLFASFDFSGGRKRPKQMR